MTNHRVFLALTLFVGIGIVLASCDTATPAQRPTEVTINGVTYAVIGQADLEQTSDGLVVGNIGSSGNDGVRVTPELPIEVADIRTMPVELPDNGRWGMQVFGETSSGRTALSTVWNQAINGAEHDIVFDFASEMNVSRMILEYYLGGELQYSVEVPSGGAGNRIANAGRGTSGPTSVHVLCVNGELIVATDYNGDAPLQGCSGELLSNVPDAPGPICADFIQARPVTEIAFPDATSLEVTARTVPQFTITDGFVGHSPNL